MRAYADLEPRGAVPRAVWTTFSANVFVPLNACGGLVTVGREPFTRPSTDAGPSGRASLSDDGLGFTSAPDVTALSAMRVGRNLLLGASD